MKCIVCGESTNRKGKIICSKNCRTIRRRHLRNGTSEPVIYHRNCKECNEPFKTKINQQVYCTTLCRNVVSKREYLTRLKDGYYLREKTERKCIICGSVNPPNRGKYCSDDCMQFAKLRRSAVYNDMKRAEVREEQIPEYEVNCIVCGELYKGYDSSGVCSLTCKRKDTLKAKRPKVDNFAYKPKKYEKHVTGWKTEQERLIEKYLGGSND